MTDDEKRAYDARNRTDINERLLAHPVVEEHPHARETHEPEEERNRPAPVGGLDLRGEVGEIHHFCTTT